MLSLEEITLAQYPQEKSNIFNLVDQIWLDKQSARQAKHSINRWGTSKTESGGYFYLKENAQIIGITGYFIPNLDEGAFGLRHHGTLVPGTGKAAMELLFKHIQKKYQLSFKKMYEFIPKGKEKLIEVFKSWGYKIDPQGVPDWEPKKDYFKYSMIYLPS